MKHKNNTDTVNNYFNYKDIGINGKHLTETINSLQKTLTLKGWKLFISKIQSFSLFSHTASRKISPNA